MVRTYWKRARDVLPRTVRAVLILSIAGLVLFGPRQAVSVLPTGWPLGGSSREAAGSDQLHVRPGAVPVTRLSVEQVAMAWPAPDGPALTRPERRDAPETAVAIAGGTRDAGRGAPPNSAALGGTANEGALPSDADADAGLEPIRAHPVFRSPIDGAVEGAFGWFRHEQFRDWRFRDGVFMSLRDGASPVVRAAAPGLVTRVAAAGETAAQSAAGGASPGLIGLVVYVDHTGGWETRYAGLSEVYVREGDRVTTGSTLGRIAAGAGARDAAPALAGTQTSAATETEAAARAVAAHLGFSIYNGGEAVDPNSILIP